MPDKPSEVIVRGEENNPLHFIAVAVEKGFSTDQLKVLFDLHNKHNENVARQAFAQAVCNVQQRIMAVVRNKENPQTHSRYADLEAIDKMLRPIYTDEGLALKFSETDCPLDNHMRVRLTVLHRLGHTDESNIDLPIDSAGIAGKTNKTLTHAKASTFTYGQRYLTVAFFNIPLTRDDDGNGGKRPSPTKSPEEVANTLRAKSLPGLEQMAEEGLTALESYWKKSISEAVRKACWDDWGTLKGIALAADLKKKEGAV